MIQNYIPKINLKKIHLKNVTKNFILSSVYCQFPGIIANGKVLLVGNMGLYDYRPYVKKVINNKQIMYDCDKGFVLEHGPVSVSQTYICELICFNRDFDLFYL